MDKEKYRKTLLRRRALCFIFIALMALPGFTLRHIAELDPYQGFSSGFVSGVMAGGIVVSAVIIWQISRALKDEKKLKELYIKEHDERERLIGFKTASCSIIFVVAGLLVAMMIACFFSMTVFYTLLAAVIFMGLSTLGFNLYFNKKI